MKVLAKFYARKNFEILIDLFRKYGKNELKDVRCIVTITAQQHKNAPKFLQDIKKYNLQKHIVNVGPLDEQQLAGYFYNCNALFFPSLLESYSSTHLEAMYFELPIITSDLDFAEYTCGDAAVYYDPWKIDGLFEMIVKLREDQTLLTELAANGKQQLANSLKFPATWQEVADGVLKGLRELAKK